MRKILAFIVAVIWIIPAFCQKATSFTTTDYVRALKHATDVMVNDVASPVAAARYYAYITLAANEAAALFDKQQPHFAGTVKELDSITADDSLVKKSNPDLAIILALYKSAAKLLPSGYLLQKKIDSLKLVAVK